MLYPTELRERGWRGMWRSILRHGPGCPSNEANGSDRCLRSCSRATIAARGLVGSRFSLCCQPGVGQAAAAWLQCAVLAHNLIRWTTIAGGVRVDNQLIVARTIRTRLVAISGRIVNRAGRPTLRLPINWPWKKAFTTALDTLRTLRPAPA